jgi:hypothetical protein
MKRRAGWAQRAPTAMRSNARLQAEDGTRGNGVTYTNWVENVLNVDEGGGELLADGGEDVEPNEGAALDGPVAEAEPGDDAEALGGADDAGADGDAGVVEEAGGGGEDVSVGPTDVGSGALDGPVERKKGQRSCQSGGGWLG